VSNTEQCHPGGDSRTKSNLSYVLNTIVFTVRWRMDLFFSMALIHFKYFNDKAQERKIQMGLARVLLSLMNNVHEFLPV